MDEVLVLNVVSNRDVWAAWTGLIWHRIRMVCGLLWVR